MTNKNSIFVSFLLILSLCLITTMPTTSSAESDPTGNISVHIVPTRFGATGGRSIEVADPSQHFYVVLTNAGKAPVRLWREWCSWGYFNLSFVTKNQHGVIVKIVKHERAWDKNYPDWTIVSPGESMVVEVTFDKSAWNDAPLPEAGTNRSMELTAVFEIPNSPEAKTNGVWTGRVTSAANTYTLYR